MSTTTPINDDTAAQLAECEKEKKRLEFLLEDPDGWTRPEIDDTLKAREEPKE